jgi:hypothetical protein
LRGLVLVDDCFDTSEPVVTNDGNAATASGDHEVPPLHEASEFLSFDKFDGLGRRDDTTVRTVTDRYASRLE